MKSFILALISVALTLSLRGADLVPDPFAPAKVTSLYVEKEDKGKITSIQLSGESIVYKVVDGGREVARATVIPTGDDWFQFIQALNAAKFYKWAPNYTSPGEGMKWLIDFAMENRKMTSVGSNDFPKDGAEDQPQADPGGVPSVPFWTVWKAALALAGKSPPPASTK